jgi:hypothetical protein
MIATSTCVDVSNVDVSDINDEYFTRDKISSMVSEEIKSALLLTSAFTKCDILITCTPFNTHSLQFHHYSWSTATEALAYSLTYSSFPVQQSN